MADNSTEKCPKCGELTEGHTASASFGGTTAGGAIQKAAPIPYQFRCRSCDHEWTGEMPGALNE
jgi:hypothetical protein